MSDDSYSRYLKDKERLQQDYKNRLTNQNAADDAFRGRVRGIGLDAAIDAGQRKEREGRREYGDLLITRITELKSKIAGLLDACPFPPSRQFLPAPSVKEMWQRTFDAIDPFADDGEAQLKRLLAKVQAHRAVVDPLGARSFDFAIGPPSGPTFAEKRQLTEALAEVERNFEQLIMYAGWWRTRLR
jgi:hypothetical protein